MKKITLGLVAMCITVLAVAQNNPDTTLLQPVEVLSVRAAENSPFAKTIITKKQILQTNTGRDLPFLLQETPSVIVNSDAGNGVGYTGIRIRGTDASRINVTLNGIPYNDAESQGPFFVDLPDIAASASNIQIQRGAGTSSNGAGSFGGAISINTNELVKNKNLSLQSAAGSYQTFKQSLLYNSGLFGKYFTVDARLSAIGSKGYIDRASSKLYSGFASAAYTAQKKSLRVNVFTGKEKTYQAWYGVAENILPVNRHFNPAGMEKEGSPYNNETDNYTQTHFQAFYNQQIQPRLQYNIGLFYTKGKGYYEQYKAGQQLIDYGLPNVMVDTQLITQTNLVRRLWLNNDFYGGIFSLHYITKQTRVIFGGNTSGYAGRHFGEIVQAELPKAVAPGYRWYNLSAQKNEGNFYAKLTQQLDKKWQAYADMQLRKVNYHINGFRANPTFKQINNYTFFNPKAGLIFNANSSAKFYVSFARVTKEPNRDDFEAAVNELPRPEKLNDAELGFENKNIKRSWGINFFYMHYQDQLVLTGKINDVGAYSRSNAPKSFRLGAELEGRREISNKLAVTGNITLSKNKIKNFTEYIDDYDNGNQQTNFYSTSNLAFSPDISAAANINYQVFKNTHLSWISKFVGRQYLDNTAQKNRSLQPYQVHDLRLAYTAPVKKISIDCFFHINNIFSEKYEANGYTFSYFYDNALTTENFYFPMAPINFIVGVNIGLGKLL
ncbi:MAG: TonB-dependent receptor plug domain-containing protein [Ferruginibacter sp.]